MKKRSACRFAAVLVLFASACRAPASQAPSRATSAATPLPDYSGRGAALFDDGIEPLAVGFALAPGPPPELDGDIRARTMLGDSVLRARVVTVTTRQESSGQGWRIVLHTIEMLAGHRAPDADFVLDVGGTGSGARVMKSFETRLVGTVVVAFLRIFAQPEGKGALHFHLAQAADDELRAVRAASLLAEVR
jgi:hypothetical protein